MPSVTDSFPLMLATWSFGQPAIASAWERLKAGGTALDAIETACRHAEADLENPTVGVAGYPDRDGTVSLDALVMLSPRQSAGVCAVTSVLHPISLARKVMESTPHKLIAGTGADALAREKGLETGELLTESTRQKWIDWKATQPTPVERPVLNIEESHDTIGVLAIDSTGTQAGGCTTSGWAYKLPGRVGDSPIIGHSMYVLPGVGSCVCTGHGELVMGICGAFLAVETLRQGGSALDSVNVVLQRMVSSYQLTDQDQVGLIVLRADGSFSSGSLRPGFQAAFRDRSRDELLAPEVVLFGS